MSRGTRGPVGRAGRGPSGRAGRAPGAGRGCRRTLLAVPVALLAASLTAVLGLTAACRPHTPPHQTPRPLMSARQPAQKLRVAGGNPATRQHQIPNHGKESAR